MLEAQSPVEVPPPAPVRSTEQVKSPEIIPTSPHFRALHGRILIGSDTLNPDNKNISPVTKEALVNGSPQILNECATNCRRKEATVGKDQLEGEINSRVSKNTLVLKQDLSKIKGFDQEKATRWQLTLTKLFGKDTASATGDEVRTLFDKYFYSKDKLGNDSNTDLFSEDVLKAFDGDTEAIEKNADCIVWYARICGFTQDYSETVFKHQITAKALLGSQPDKLVEELNQKQTEDKPARINDINEDEDQVLRFIWGNRGGEVTPIEPKKPDETKPDETKPTPETKDETDEKIEQKPFESGKDYTMVEMFNAIKGKVDTKHRFFIENPPNKFTLTDEEINKLKLVEPFIINIKTDGNRVTWEVNQKVVPFVLELEKNGTSPNQRFINGEKATDGDSGLVGLAAASAENSEKQALLYGDLTNSIISIHEKNPNLLGQWLERQKQLEESGLNSIALLTRYEFDKPGNLKPEQERLFYFSEDKLKNHQDQVFEDFLPTWQKRIAELKQVISENKLQKHHLRWIELLAHSVDVNGLMSVIKEKAGLDKTAPETPAEALNGGEEEKKNNNLLTRLKAKFPKKP